MTTISSKNGASRTQPGAAVDAQRVAAARDQEDQAHVRVGEDVAEAVGAPVAGPLGDRDRAVVEDVDEAGRVALGRDVAVAVRRRTVATRQNGDAASQSRSVWVGAAFLVTARGIGDPSRSSSSAIEVICIISGYGG